MGSVVQPVSSFAIGTGCQGFESSSKYLNLTSTHEIKAQLLEHRGPLSTVPPFNL